MDSEYQTMEQFLRWAGELGVSDSTDPSRSHHSCLGHYGFTLEVNSNDKVFIPLEISLYALASSWPKDSLYIHQDGKPSFALVSMLRLWHTPQTYLDPTLCDPIQN
ncbi:hypothetical protein Bca52824_056011 [Brassica carinata]|uniref:Uncharacterized protein n=1 Tax=Brassica carinata TaxID=52824 RepID=A0A8X7UP76_BRACI|nr:hypothetical protein Bca52824_056011 [Brassica carinata]